VFVCEGRDYCTDYDDYMDSYLTVNLLLLINQIDTQANKSVFKIVLTFLSDVYCIKTHEWIVLIFYLHDALFSHANLQREWLKTYTWFIHDEKMFHQDYFLFDFHHLGTIQAHASCMFHCCSSIERFFFDWLSFP
jgi:hypothetical protein